MGIFKTHTRNSAIEEKKNYFWPFFADKKYDHYCCGSDPLLIKPDYSQIACTNKSYRTLSSYKTLSIKLRKQYFINILSVQQHCFLLLSIYLYLFLASFILIISRLLCLNKETLVHKSFFISFISPKRKRLVSLFWRN